MIYFDNAATTAVSREVVDVIDKILLSDWGNPSSLHRKGLEAERILEASRASIADRLGVKPKTIIFTSCATESNNTVLRGMCSGKSGINLVVSPVEHSSVHETALALAAEGIEVRFCAVDRHGRTDAEQVASLVDAHTALVSVMHVNNELGTIQPVERIAECVKRKNPRVKMHVDGVQALGKLPVDLGRSTIDFYTASGHKLHAPKGIGLLYVREGAALPSLLFGGGHERGMRPGTPNVAFAAGFAKALELASSDGDAMLPVYRRARARAQAMTDAVINSPEDGSPYILNFGMKGVKSEVLLHFMEQSEMYLSGGSACNGARVSRVLGAIGVEDDYIQGCVRLSFVRETTPEEVDAFFDELENAVAQIRLVTRGGRR